MTGYICRRISRSEAAFWSGKGKRPSLKVPVRKQLSAKEGMITEFISRPVPDNWLTWDLDRRRDFWSAGGTGDYNLVPRDRISVIEVWSELFLNRASDIKKTDKDEIKKCLLNAEGWQQARGPFYGGAPYGTQRGFVRAPEED